MSKRDYLTPTRLAEVEKLDHEIKKLSMELYVARCDLLSSKATPPRFYRNHEIINVDDYRERMKACIKRLQSEHKAAKAKRKELLKNT